MDNLNTKLYKLQSEIGSISKNSKNPFYNSKYFDINNLIKHLNPFLIKHKLLLLQPITNNQVRSVISDLEGNSVESSIKLPKNLDAQKLGSAITYFRRYTLTSLLALQAGDDDANLAVTKPVLEENKGQWNAVVNSLKNDKTDLNYVKSKFDISKVENILTKLNK
jgi:hypothetical protein|tara:strand:+ start:440 stop:934 length:495 start_codon:yes stop_codon:yes gene_type:complete